MASGCAPRSYNRNRFPLRAPETGLRVSVNCAAAAIRAISPSLLRDRVMVAMVSHDFCFEHLTVFKGTLSAQNCSPGRIR